MRIIAGKFKGRALQSPPAPITRPTSDRARESIFNILCHLPGFEMEGATVLDIFAGSGALGLEALSRGAKAVIFIDKNATVCQVIGENSRSLQVEPYVQILPTDALNLPIAKQAVQLVFMDPPYFQNLEYPLLKELGRKKWLQTGTIIVVETSRKTVIEGDKSLFEVIKKRSFSNTLVTFFQVL